MRKNNMGFLGKGEKQMKVNRHLVLVWLCLSLGLFPVSAGADDYLDQWQTAHYSYQAVSYSVQRGQTFNARMYGSLDRVRLHLENFTNSYPAGAELIVSVQTVDNGVPTGVEIGRGAIALSEIPASGSGGDWVDIFIQRGAVVHAWKQYALVLRTNNLNAQVNWWFAGEGGPSGSSYTIGRMIHNYGNGWIMDVTLDFAFETYVIPDVVDKAQMFHWGFPDAYEATMAQIFIPTRTGIIDRVDVNVGNQWGDSAWTPAELIEVSIQTVNGDGNPSGKVLGRGSFLAPRDPYDAAYGIWVNNIDISGAHVIAGIPYALVLHTDKGAVCWNYITSSYNIYPIPENPGGSLLKYNCHLCPTSPDSGGEWAPHLATWFDDLPVWAQYSVHMVPMIPAASPAPPPMITPCSSGVCPAVSGNITTQDSTARITSNVQFKELPSGKVQGILNFNDSRTGELVLNGCTTSSTACKLTVKTLACTDQNSITVAGTYTPQGESTGNYLLTLSGKKGGIGTFTLNTGDYTYSLTHEGIVDVTCPH